MMATNKTTVLEQLPSNGDALRKHSLVDKKMIKKIITLFCTVLCLSFLVMQNPAWATGQFSASCEKRSLFNDTNLSANCKMLNDNIHFGAFIDLNNHIQNQEGRLAWDTNGGHFKETCSQYRLNTNQDQLPLLYAACSASNGMTTFSSINLDEHIANIDGDLTYE